MFKSVDPKPNFPKLEEKILRFWKENDTLSKYLSKNQASKNRFSFLDGPITANNPMGVHHAWGRTLKDLYQRYKNMQGLKQRFQNGFDCQGLWVEVEVERDIGFNSKKDIEKFGVGKFTQACKDRVDKFATIQTEQSKRLGMFMDWENSYFTNSETNNLYIWHFLKTINEKGWLYKGKSTTTWCPRCETGLSQHEQADGYKDIKDISVYLKFKLKDLSNEYVLVWTTTPWTLPANVLLAINTDFPYVKVEEGGEVLYLAEQSARRLGFKELEKVDATSLLGLEYDALYDIPAQDGVEHKIVEWSLVDPAEGTGVVHVAPGCGQEDYELGKELGAAVISPLDETGTFVEGFGNLFGKFAHEVGDEVVQYLESKGVLYKTETARHRYPHCWRCGTKCVFRLEDDWFIDCRELKPKLKKHAESVAWIPEFVGKRMQDWLTNMGDWMISRKRYYGLSLPFYECGCGELTVVGSKEELRELAVDPGKVDKLPSLHRPWIDKVLIKCPSCGKAVKRIPDVGDCWLDAGVVPFSTLKYLEDKSYWNQWFPAEFICEMIEQVRLWYYSMLVYATVFEDRPPYLSVLSYVEVRDEDGERMSKTRGNGIPYDGAVGKMGADVMRWLYARQNPAANLNFGYGPAEEIKRRFFMILWNCYKFFVSYANVDRWTPDDGRAKGAQLHVLDRWVLSRLNQLIKTVTDSLDNYDAFAATRAIEDFVVNDFSTWYIRRSRDRIGPTAPDGSDKLVCYQTLYEVLLTLTKLLAPFTPFLAEEVYQGLSLRSARTVLSESVHLEDWQEADGALIDEELEKQMELVREIVERGHAARKDAGIKVRQPLASLKISNLKSQISNKEELIQLIKDELNVKEVEFTDGKGELEVKLDTKITPELKAEGEARELVRQIQNLRKEAGCQLNDKIIVEAPSWPQNFTDYIKQKTLATELKKGQELKVMK